MGHSALDGQRIVTVEFVGGQVVFHPGDFLLGLRSVHSGLVAKSVLLLDLPALLLFSQQRKDLLELVVFLSIVAELGLQGAYTIDRAIVLQRQLVIEDSIRRQFFFLSQQFTLKPVDFLKKNLRVWVGLLLGAAVSTFGRFLAFFRAYCMGQSLRFSASLNFSCRRRFSSATSSSSSILLLASLICW